MRFREEENDRTDRGYRGISPRHRKLKEEERERVAGGRFTGGQEEASQQ